MRAMRQCGVQAVMLLLGLLAATAALAQPANDSFANARVLSGASATDTGSNVGATVETGEPNHAGNVASESVWWRWTALGSGLTTVSTAGSSFDTVLAVYTGSAVNSLTLVGSNDDSVGLTSRVDFTATAGTTYRFAVDGFGSATGTITIAVQGQAAPDPNASPVVAAIPGSGSTFPLRPAFAGGRATGRIDIVTTPGTGTGSAAVTCTGAAGLAVSAAGDVPQTSRFDFNVPTAGTAPDLALAASVTGSAFDTTLACVVTPSAGAPYTLNFTVTVPAALAAGAGDWVAEGPGPVTNGQTEGIAAPLRNPVAGAVHVVLPHPTNADVLYVGAVNGGVWRTSNARAGQPSWTQLTDGQTSLSVGALGFDTADTTRQTLVAGIGRYSSYAGEGGQRSGLLRTTNGGASWTPLAASMAGRNIAGVAARGNVILAASNTSDSNSCADFGLFRSSNSGASFSKVTNGLPGGGVDALAGHPGNPNVFYASLEAAGACAGDATRNGIYRSGDAGVSWSKVSDAALDALLENGTISGYLYRIQVAPTGEVAFAVSLGELLGVFHSDDEGASWTNMGVPLTQEGAEQVGIHPGGQGGIHLSLAIDPNNPNRVYVGGDRQPVGGDDSFPNSIGAQNFSGRLFRGDASVAAPNTWTPLTHSDTASNSSPHADSRSMAFAADGRLVEGDDGGVYARTTPGVPGGDWVSLNGDLQITEQHSLAYDRNSRVALSGNQDNGSMRQTAAGNRLWNTLNQGDGGDVAVDRLAFGSAGRSVAYSSAQRLGGFRRRVHDQTNAVIESVQPNRAVVDGSAEPAAQFVTPIATNAVAGGRLVIGAGNGVYESLDAGDTLRQVLAGLRASSFPVGGSLAYGASDNPDVLYMAGCIDGCGGGDDDGVYRRRSIGETPTRVRATPDDRSPVAVSLDPGNANHVFVLEQGDDGSSTLLRSSNGGDAFSVISGGFPAGAGVLRSMRFVPSTAGGLLAVGSENGVFFSTAAGNFSNWTALGNGLPRAPVSRLDYDAGQDLLVVGTLGRGAFSLSGLVLRHGGESAPLGNRVFANGFEDGNNGLGLR